MKQNKNIRNWINCFIPDIWVFQGKDLCSSGSCMLALTNSRRTGHKKKLCFYFLKCNSIIMYSSSCKFIKMHKQSSWQHHPIRVKHLICAFVLIFIPASSLCSALLMMASVQTHSAWWWRLLRLPANWWINLLPPLAVLPCRESAALSLLTPAAWGQSYVLNETSGNEDKWSLGILLGYWKSLLRYGAFVTLSNTSYSAAMAVIGWSPRDKVIVSLTSTY